MAQIGYKVVRRREGSNVLVSCYAPGAGELEYKIGVKTKRQKNCGPLAVFDTPRYAKMFILFNAATLHSELKELHIYKCKYGKSKAKLHEELTSRTSREIVLWCFSRGQEINERPDEFMSRGGLPPGTRLAEWVKLLEEISWSSY